MALTISLYTNPNCERSEAARGELAKRGIRFHERSAADHRVALMAHGFNSDPVIAFAIGCELVAWQGHRVDMLALLADLIDDGPIPDDGLSNHDEAAEAVVTRMQAMREIRRHQLNADDFFAECGNEPLYRGSTVLNWLGY